jgi:NADPH2 dehydrogenase/N-ethylmaleimide reductase
MTAPLFVPFKLGDLTLDNRIVMAPMTRNRADIDGCANALMVEYYAQRATSGLIIAEGTYPSFVGQAYSRQPGIVNDDQIASWRKVTDAVHAEGGKIFLQIMHAGRVGSHHIKAKINGKPVATVAPSAIAAQGKVFTDDAGMQPFDVPEALTTEQVYAVVEEHLQAARNAKEAGFDGVELHCTSGYLPMQFLCTSSNQRNDEFGGDIARRAQFVIACLNAMISVFGSDRVGIRINPGNSYNDCPDDDSLATHVHLLKAIAPLELGYLHIMRSPLKDIDAFALAQEYFNGVIIANDNFSPQSAAEVIAETNITAVSFARHFIANPDFVRRVKQGNELATFNRKTLYTPGAEGYTDYPSLTQ